MHASVNRLLVDLPVSFCFRDWHLPFDDCIVLYVCSYTQSLILSLIFNCLNMKFSGLAFILSRCIFHKYDMKRVASTF